MTERTQAEYARQIRNFARALRRGAIGRNEFVDAMEPLIRRQFTDAWESGARAMGFVPQEFEPEDIAPLETFITDESPFLPGFADFAEAASDSPASALEPRILQWANRWTEIRQAAIVHFGANKKLEWIFDPAKENCEDCARLNGQVRRAKFWNERGLHPLAMILQCGPGRQCGCRLEETSKPATRGRLPKIVGP